MKNFQFWQRWLLVVGILITVFGLLMAFASSAPLFELFNRQVDPAFWGARPVSPEAASFRDWIYGVWGATIAGWGVAVIFVAQEPFRRNERWAWYCLTVGVGGWYLLDTALSLVYGVWFNVVFNTLLLLLVAPPLLLTYRDFFKGKN